MTQPTTLHRGPSTLTFRSAKGNDAHDQADDRQHEIEIKIEGEIAGKHRRDLDKGRENESVSLSGHKPDKSFYTKGPAADKFRFTCL